MADIEKIKAALAQLDPLDDDQWTADGAPKVETVAALVGEAVKRQDIVNAAPDFNREKAAKGDDDSSSDGGDGGQGEGGDGDEQSQEQPNPDQPEQSEPEANAGEGEDEDDLDLQDISDEALEKEFTEAEFLEYLRQVPKEELEGIEASLNEQNDKIGLKIRRAQELQKRIARASQLTRQRIKEEFPNSTDAHAIRAFIDAQNASRAARAERRSTVLKHVRPEDLDFRAPIDAAMARKTKRGAQRPVRPLIK